MLHKTLRVRRDSAPAEKQYDLLYADFSADWQAAIQGVYNFLGLPLQASAISAMEQWVQGNRQHQHGTHKYSLADFKLDEQDVDRRLMFYREQFDIAYEHSHPHEREKT